MGARGWYQFWLVRLLVAALAAFSVEPLQASDYVITDDGGGSVITYMGSYEYLSKRGDRVVIDGFCASACTIALHYPKTCVTDRAILGFHQAYFNINGVRVTAKETTALLFSYYPVGVQKWITEHGGMTRSLLVMGPKTAGKLLPICSGGS